jgi:hypothetical protein
MSARFTAVAATRMRTWPGSSAGSGTSAERSTDASPGPSQTIAFMGTNHRRCRKRLQKPIGSRGLQRGIASQLGPADCLEPTLGSNRRVPLRLPSIADSRECRSLIFVTTLGLLVSSCARVPQDAHRSLAAIAERGMLRAGVMAAPPWITGAPPGTPGGIESALLLAFAAELGVTVDWHWGSPDELFAALEGYELDVLVGGITATNPWRERVDFSGPHHSSRALVGLPVGHAPLRELDGAAVAVRPASGLQALLRQRGAEVVVREDLQSFDGPIAAPEWELDALGLESSGICLREQEHVMAVPPGERALAARLERFLRGPPEREVVQHKLDLSR